MCTDQMPPPMVSPQVMASETSSMVFSVWVFSSAIGGGGRTVRARSSYEELSASWVHVAVRDRTRAAHIFSIDFFMNILKQHSSACVFT